MSHPRTSSLSLERLSLNQMTVDTYRLQEAIEACARAEIPYIGIWRHKLQDVGLTTASRWIQDAGLKVSSLCRGGMFPAADKGEREKRLDDNRRAIVEAAELGTDTLVLVCGGLYDKDVTTARKWVEEGIAQLVPFAQQHHVKLGIEPLHPMYAADRSVIVSLQHANQLASRYQPHEVGVVIDVFHVWWDPYLYQEIERASGHIYGFHVNDWLVPLPDVLYGRGMMGDGVIDLQQIRSAVDLAGYTGPIEVEIFNRSVWEQPIDQTLAHMKKRFIELC